MKLHDIREEIRKGITMKKILCPTDFSATADNAVAYAAKLSQRTGAHLALFNVQSLVDRTPEEAILGEQVNALLAYDRLEELSREVSKVFKISCNGNVATTISGLSGIIESEAGGHDLIVMGTNGPDSIYQFLFGSHSYRLAKQTALPVLIIPHGCGYSDIQQTAFAFDYWRSNTLPMKQLAKVIKSLKSKLTVLEVLEESYSRKAEEEIIADQQLLRDAYHEIELQFHTLYTSHVAQALDEYVREGKVDLLALCTQHQNFIDRLFHKSLIKELSRIATYPLLILHQ
jgi:nucleotide-binding universal stress UspA family protein